MLHLNFFVVIVNLLKIHRGFCLKFSKNMRFTLLAGDDMIGEAVLLIEPVTEHIWFVVIQNQSPDNKSCLVRLKLTDFPTPCRSFVLNRGHKTSLTSRVLAKLYCFCLCTIWHWNTLIWWCQLSSYLNNVLSSYVRRRRTNFACFANLEILNCFNAPGKLFLRIRWS